MKKNNILKKNLDFKKIISKKKQLISKHLIIYYEESEKFEIGISTPKKFANAVKRNFIKRQIKWILDNFVNYQKIKKRIVLIVRKEFIDLKMVDKKEKIIKIFLKLCDKQG